MTKKFPFLTNYRLVCLLWIAVAAFCWHYKFKPDRYNNYVIFKYVYHHTVAQKNLYQLYPEYGDYNYYGPVFSLVVAPFAVLPDAWGFFLWSMASAVVLLWAIHLLPLSTKRKMLLLLFCSIEFANTVHNIQFNTIITAFIIFSFLLVERKKDEWATLFIVLGAMVKLYPIVGLAFFVFSKNKSRFILSTLVWFVLFMVLPMLISSRQFVLQSYVDWFHALQGKNLMNIDFKTAQDISFMGVCRRFLNNPDLPNLPFLIFGGLTLAAPLLRFKQYKSVLFRLQFLASALITVVLFSTGSEHPTYIIAVTGAVLWVFLQAKPFTGPNMILLTLLLVITGLGLTDAFPKAIREDIISNYVMKAWPCIIVWFIISYQLLFKNFLTTDLTTDNKSAVFSDRRKAVADKDITVAA